MNDQEDRSKNLEIIGDYLNQAWWTKENANVQYSVSAMNRDLAAEASKNYWLKKVYNEPIRTGYKKRLYHIHDLGFIGIYCVGWDIEDLLLRGFRGQPGAQSSSPAKHFNSALGQIYNFLYTLQNEAAGAEAFSNFDTYLSPFVHYDGLSQEEVDQAIQVFIYNMNVRTRQANQSPFTNLTLDQKIPKFMEDDYTIRNGEYTDYVYGDFQEEMDMINEAWWKQRIKGDADGRPQPFPIETLNITEDFNWDNELMFKAIALRGSPYFANFIGTDRDPSEVRSMCCHLELPLTELRNRGGGFFGANPLTGSVGVVTMNLPLMGYLANDEDEFFDILNTGLELAKDSLERKRETLEVLIGREPTLYPFSKFYLKSVNERFDKWWINHFSTLGLVGMNEACLNLINEDITSDEGLKLTRDVLRFMRERALDFQDETGHLFNVEKTPAESTCYRLALGDKKEYPDIITNGTDEAPYYTNGTDIPVDVDRSLGFYLGHQEQVQPLFTGGTVFHIWGNDAVPRWRNVSELVKRVAENYKLPYYSYSPTTSICPNCGFIVGEHFECPTCGADCEVWQRVTGFFTRVSNWNKGKRQEYRERHHFTLS